MATAHRRRIGAPLSRRSYLITSVTTFVALLVIWTLVTVTGWVSPVFLPSPVAVLGALAEQLGNGELAAATAASVYRITVGFLAATVMAVPLGIWMATSNRVEAAVEPFADFVRYMPVVAFVPMTILWVGIGDLQKFVIIWLGTFFQQLLMVTADVARVPRALIDLGETLGMSNGKILRRIVLPAAAPRIWDTLRITLGWAWTWLVVAELVAATSGLGYRITLAQRFLATDVIIGYVLVLGVLGLVTDQLMRWIGRRVFAYERVQR